MKEKLIKLIKKEVISRDTIPYGYPAYLHLKFEDGEPTINIRWEWNYKTIVKFYFFGLCSREEEVDDGHILEIHCGSERYTLTKEETKDLEDFVKEQDRIKTENKIDKRLKIHESKN